MSMEALSQFLKKVADDPELQSKLIEFAAKQGFEFSADELSEADLDCISGGPNRRPHDHIGETKVKPPDYKPPAAPDPKIP